jgi:hypothetical protein
MPIINSVSIKVVRFALSSIAEQRHERVTASVDQLAKHSPADSFVYAEKPSEYASVVLTLKLFVQEV